MSLKQKALTSVIWTAVVQFSEQGLQFILSIVLARLLLPEEFGLIALIAIFTSLANVLIDSGLNNSIIRSQSIDDIDLSSIFFFNFAMSGLIYLLIFLFAPLISIFYEQPQLTLIIRVYCLSFLFYAIGLIQRSLLFKNMAFKKLTKINIPAILISGSFSVFLAYNGYGVWSLVYGHLAQSFLMSFFLIIAIRWRPRLIFNYPKFLVHWRYGYKLLLSSILDTVFNNLYYIIIGKFYSASKVGYYNRAETLKQLPVNNIAAILNKVTFPLFSKVQDDLPRLKTMYSKIMTVVVFFVAPVLFVGAALAEPLFEFVLTKKWLPAVPYFQILCLNGILYPIHAYNLNILMVIGRTDLFLKLEIKKKILFVIIIIISINWGIYGLLWGSVLNSCLAFFVNTHYSGKFLKYNSLDQFKDIAPYILFALVSGTIVYIFDQFIFTFYPLYLRVFIGTISGTIIYLLISKLIHQRALIDILDLKRSK